MVYFVFVAFQVWSLSVHMFIISSLLIVLFFHSGQIQMRWENSCFLTIMMTCQFYATDIFSTVEIINVSFIKILFKLLSIMGSLDFSRLVLWWKSVLYCAIYFCILFSGFIFNSQIYLLSAWCFKIVACSRTFLDFFPIDWYHGSAPYTLKYEFLLFTESQKLSMFRF